MKIQLSDGCSDKRVISFTLWHFYWLLRFTYLFECEDRPSRKKKVSLYGLG